MAKPKPPPRPRAPPKPKPPRAAPQAAYNPAQYYYDEHGRRLDRIINPRPRMSPEERERIGRAFGTY
jgi:hypothetical protein